NLRSPLHVFCYSGTSSYPVDSYPDAATLGMFKGSEPRSGMTAPAAKGYAYNRTRKTYLATDLAVANTHWSRLMGLMGTPPADFPAGKGLWIVPCRGVHSMAMRFPIDVIYPDRTKQVVHLEQN